MFSCFEDKTENKTPTEQSPIEVKKKTKKNLEKCAKKLKGKNISKHTEIKTINKTKIKVSEIILEKKYVEIFKSESKSALIEFFSTWLLKTCTEIKAKHSQIALIDKTLLLSSIKTN